MTTYSNSRLSFYGSTQLAFENVFAQHNPTGLRAIGRNFLQTNISRFSVDEVNLRNEAFRHFCDVMKSEEKLQSLIQFILTKGMYPFCQNKYEETMKKAKLFSTDKEQMSSLLKKTKFCTNWKHTSSVLTSDPLTGYECKFAHSLEEYNPSTCIFGLFCEKDDCELNHGVLTKEEWIQFSGVVMPTTQLQKKNGFCVNVLKKKRCCLKNCPYLHSVSQLFDTFPETKNLVGMELMTHLLSIRNCPNMDSIWQLFIDFPKAKELSAVELTTQFSIPFYIFQSTELNVYDKEKEQEDEIKFTEELKRRLDMEEEVVVDDIKEEEDEDEDEGPTIIIRVETKDELEFEKNQRQFVFETEMNHLQYDEVKVVYDEYVTTMSDQLDLPQSMIYKMVCDGKTKIIEEWLEKRIGAD
jgi:hypothetical protein